MKNRTAKRILVPLDLMRSPSDALIIARNLAAESPVSLTLLYVLNLNIMTPSREVYNELCEEGEVALRRLAWLFFGTDRAARIVVREGVPHQEIVAEAAAESSDLIILSGSNRPAWKRWLHWGTAQRIVDAAPCPALLLPGRRDVAPRWLEVAPPQEPSLQTALPAAWPFQNRRSQSDSAASLSGDFRPPSFRQTG